MLLELTYYFLITLLVIHQHHHYVNMTQKNVQAPIDMESDVLKNKSDSLLKKPICKDYTCRIFSSKKQTI